MLVGEAANEGMGRLSVSSWLGVDTAPLLFSFLFWALFLQPDPSTAVYPKALIWL